MNKLRSFISIFSLFFVFSSAFAYAQQDTFEQYVKQALIDRNVAGVSVARIENGEIVQQIAMSHPDINKPLVSPQTIFQVGSISKPVAAWVVMTLVRDNKVDLDAPVSQYITRWELPDSEFDASGVTVGRLLSHTAGLSLHGYPGFLESDPLPTLEASLSGDTGGSGSVYIAIEPGKQFRYSGGGYTLLQLMVEEVTGMTFSEYAKESVLDPLGMLGSSYTPDADLKSQRATPYSALRPIDQYHFTAEAAASLHSTSGDLAKFALANMLPNSVLEQELVTKLHSGVMDIGPNQIGLGFFIEPSAGLIGHKGANQGWRASLSFSPDESSALIILSNGNNADLLNYQIRCFWEEEYGKGTLTERCNRRITSINEKKSLFVGIAWAFSLMGLGLIVWRFISVKNNRMHAGLPTSKVRWALFVLLMIILIVGKFLLNTSSGASLLSGFPTRLTAMDFVPEGGAELWFGIQVFLVCAIVFTLARKQLKG